MKNKILKNLLAGFIGLVVALLLFEVVLRIFGVVHTMQAETDVGEYAQESQNLIICYGDSFTEGLGAPEGNGYPDVLQRLMKQNYADSIVVLNRGIAGSNSSQVLQRMKMDFKKVRPALITIMSGGANNWNLMGMPETKRFWQNLRVVQFVELVVTNLQSQGAEQEGMLDEEAWQKAQSKYEKRIAENPADGAAYYEMAYYYVNELKLEKAIELFKQGTEKAPKYPKNYIGLYEVNKWLEHKDQSAQWLEKGIAELPGYAHFHVLLIQVYLSENRGGVLDVIGRAVEHCSHSRQLFRLLVALRQNTSAMDENAGLLDSLIAVFDTQNLQNTPSPMVYYPGHMLYDPKDVDEEEYDSYIEWAMSDLREMIALCRANNIPVIVMNYPVADPPRSKNLLPWTKYISQAIKETAEEEKAAFLDIAKVFNDLGEQKRYYQHQDFQDDHCNSRGYQLIAQKLYEHIMERSYLRPR